MGTRFTINTVIENIDTILEESEKGDKFDDRPLEHDTTHKERLINSKRKLMSIRDEMDIVGELRDDFDFTYENVKDIEYLEYDSIRSPTVHLSHGKKYVPDRIEEVVDEYDNCAYDRHESKVHIRCSREEFESDVEARL